MGLDSCKLALVMPQLVDRPAHEAFHWQFTQTVRQSGGILLERFIKKLTADQVRKEVQRLRAGAAQTGISCIVVACFGFDPQQDALLAELSAEVEVPLVWALPHQSTEHAHVITADFKKSLQQCAEYILGKSGANKQVYVDCKGLSNSRVGIPSRYASFEEYGLTFTEMVWADDLREDSFAQDLMSAVSDTPLLFCPRCVVAHRVTDVLSAYGKYSQKDYFLLCGEDHPINIALGISTIGVDFTEVVEKTIEVVTAIIADVPAAGVFHQLTAGWVERHRRSTGNTLQPTSAERNQLLQWHHYNHERISWELNRKQQISHVYEVAQSQLQIEVAQRIEAQDELKRANQRLELLSITDALTGLYNHRHFVNTLSAEVSRARRLDYDFSCIMLDIDHFKRVNDTYGHAFGDLVLKQFGAFILRRVRATDIACRYGGEEFALLLPYTSCEGAIELVTQLIEEAREQAYCRGTDTIQVTISAGIACLTDEEISEPRELISRADQALYAAKEGGRDGYRVWKGEM